MLYSLPCTRVILFPTIISTMITLCFVYIVFIFYDFIFSVIHSGHPHCYRSGVCRIGEQIYLIIIRDFLLPFLRNKCCAFADGLCSVQYIIFTVYQVAFLILLACGPNGGIYIQSRVAVIIALYLPLLRNQKIKIKVALPLHGIQ